MSEEIEIILRELLYGDTVYKFEVYKNDLIEDIKALNSFTLSWLLDRCLFYEISPLFMYLLISKMSDKNLEMIFELTMLYRNKLISMDDFLEIFDYILREKKTVSEISKITLSKLRIVLTNKAKKKNSLFIYDVLLLEFNSLPILDSGFCLTKSPSSLKIRPSTLFPYCHSISLQTVKFCLNNLKSYTSPIIIFSTLLKINNLYVFEENIRNKISSINFSSVNLEELHDLVDEINSCLDGELYLI